MRLRSIAVLRPATLSLLVALPLAACGGGGDVGADSAAAGAQGTDSLLMDAAMPGAAVTGASDDAPLGAGDLEAYERALTAEVELLRDAVRRRGDARTAEDTLAAMMAAAEMQTVPAAAERAGLTADRYRRLEEAFGRAVGARLQNPGMRDMMAQADTSHLATLPAAEAEQARAQIRESARQMEAAYGDSATYASVPTPLLEAFKARAAATLDSLWQERFALRARAAGIAR